MHPGQWSDALLVEETLHGEPACDCQGVTASSGARLASVWRPHRVRPVLCTTPHHHVPLQGPSGAEPVSPAEGGKGACPDCSANAWPSQSQRPTSGLSATSQLGHTRPFGDALLELTFHLCVTSAQPRPLPPGALKAGGSPCWDPAQPSFPCLTPSQDQGPWLPESAGGSWLCSVRLFVCPSVRLSVWGGPPGLPPREIDCSRSSPRPQPTKVTRVARSHSHPWIFFSNRSPR